MSAGRWDERCQRDAERGEQFERYLAAELGIEHSRDFEKRLGAEVKKDFKFRQTGNLFIETEERRTTEGQWYPAGPFVHWNPPKFLIGDEQTYWIFDCARLRNEASKRAIIGMNTDTGRGFLLSIPEADRICERRVGQLPGGDDSKQPEPAVPANFATFAEHAVAFDTETHLIQPGLLAPPLVCGSEAEYTAAWGHPMGELLDRDGTRARFVEMISGDVILVGADVAYDMLVMAADAARRGIDLMPAIFRAYQDGRVFDIQIAETLHAIALGCLGRDPVTGQALKGRYSLDQCVELVLGRSNAKVNDRFRLSYALLENVPMDQWPSEARRYPVDDAVNTLEVALEQVKTRKNLHDVSAQCFKAWALHLGAAWGLRADANEVETLAAAAEYLSAAGLDEFKELGWVRPDGSENTGAVKRAVALAYGCSGTCATCNGTAKVPSPTTGKPINCKDCSATGLDLTTAPVPRTDKGAVQTGRDILIESGDEKLMAYGAHQEDDKILSTYVPFLREAVAAPVCLRPNAVLETGRVSYSGPVQLLPRQVSARLLAELRRRGSKLMGVRDCFAARPGRVYYSNDYTGGELVTFSEACVKRVGHSTMGQALNAGQDVHILLGAQIARVSYDEFSQRKKEKRFKDLRQAAKPINFGCPGGIGAVKIVLQQRKQGPDTPHPTGPSMVSDGKGVFVAGYKGLRFCILVDGADACGIKKVNTWGKDLEGNSRAIPPTCLHCIEVAERLRKGWFDTFPEATDYLNWHKRNVKEYGWVEQIYSKRIRGGTEYTSESNGDFQALLADIAGRALCRVATEQYADKSSPLYGVSRGILFAHDELFGEVVEAHGHDVSMRINEIMIEEFKKGCPHHEAACKAESTLMRRWWKAAEPVWENGRLMPWEPKV